MFDIVCLDINGKVITYLTQWDIGQSLIIKNIDLASPPFFHFYNQNSKEAYVVSSTLEDNVVTVHIPNILLQESIPIVACLYAYASPTSGKTLATVKIPVRPRPKPSGYNYVEDNNIISTVQLMKMIDSKIPISEKGAANGVAELDKNGKVPSEQLPRLVYSIEDLTYNNSNYSDCTNVKLAIDKLFEKVDYTEPVITSLTMSPSTTVYEIGHTIAVNALTFVWALNKNVTSVAFDGTSLTASLRTTKNTAIVSSNKTFTLTVSDGQKTTSKSLSISFQPKIYYGSSNKTSGFDSAFVLSLANSRLCSSRIGSFIMTAGTDEYAYICIPARYGTPSVKIGGFDTELVLTGTISNKNESGYTESYNIYRTGQKNLGTITMEIT